MSLLSGLFDVKWEHMYFIDFFFSVESFSKAQYIRILLMGNPKRLSNK